MAIVAKTTNSTMADKILAAKVADNLLKINNVEASFVLVKIDDTVHVSARSGGNVNVHLILEEMGGGGHFDSAGAQLGDENLENADAPKARRPRKMSDDGDDKPRRPRKSAVKKN